MGIESKDVTFTIEVTKTIVPDTYPDKIANSVEEAAQYEADVLMTGEVSIDEWIGDDEVTITFKVNE